MRIAIYLDKEHPAFSEVQKEVSGQLSALETISFKKEVEPTKPGTLGLPGEVVSFVAHHYRDIFQVISGIIKILSFIEKRKAEASKKSAKKPPPIFVLVAGDKTLKLPSSASAQKKFLSNFDAKKSKKS